MPVKKGVWTARMSHELEEDAGLLSESLREMMTTVSAKPRMIFSSGSMAHPDWKFGDVVEHRNGAGTKVLLTSRNPDGDWIGQALDAGLSTLGQYSIPHVIIDDWQLVPEPDD